MLTLIILGYIGIVVLAYKFIKIKVTPGSIGGLRRDWSLLS